MDPFYVVVRVIARLWIWFFFTRVEVRHAERLPRMGVLFIHHPNTRAGLFEKIIQKASGVSRKPVTHLHGSLQNAVRRQDPTEAASLRVGPWSTSRTDSRGLRSGIMVSRSRRPSKEPTMTRGARPGSWPLYGVPVPRCGGGAPLKGTAESAKLSNFLNYLSGTSVASVKRHLAAIIQRPKTGE